MDIKSITNKDDTFYPLMGPYLANREVVKELGYPIYDDDDKVWFIAFKDDTLAGFCYLQPKGKNKYTVGSSYVVKSFRREGVFRGLITRILVEIKGSKVELISNKEEVGKVLLSLGFVGAGKRGSYIIYRREQACL